MEAVGFVKRVYYGRGMNVEKKTDAEPGTAVTEIRNEPI